LQKLAINLWLNQHRPNFSKRL